MQSIPASITDAIVPRLLPDLEILAYRKTRVVAVQVHPSQTRPHHLSRSGPQAGTYVRVGPTNRRADAALVGEMQRFARSETFDERAMPGYDSEAIDFRAASECVSAVRRIGIRFLVTLRAGRVGPEVLDATDRAIVELIRAPDGFATREIAERIGLTPRATRTRLAALVALGLVREIGTGPQDPKRHYFSTK